MIYVYMVRFWIITAIFIAADIIRDSQTLWTSQLQYTYHNTMSIIFIINKMENVNAKDVPSYG